MSEASFDANSLSGIKDLWDSPEQIPRSLSCQALKEVEEINLV